MTTIGSQVPGVSPRFTGSPNCRALMLGSILLPEAADEFAQDAGPDFAQTLQIMRPGIRAQLFGDPPAIHKVFSIHEFEPETIEQLVPRAKLLLAEQMFDYTAGMDERMAKTVRAMLVSGAMSVEGRIGKRLMSFRSSETDALHAINDAIEEGLSGFDYSLAVDYRSSYVQAPVKYKKATRAVAERFMSTGEVSDEYIAELVRREPKPRILREGKGYSVDAARRELATSVSLGLINKAKSSAWIGKKLEIVMPLAGVRSWGEHESLQMMGALAWPPRPDDPQLKAFERILGWKFHVSLPEKDQVKITIDFGDSYYEE